MEGMQLIALTEKLGLINDEASLKDKMLYEALVSAINQLAKDDFEKLISVLYRMDIDEQKLRYLLKHEKDSNAGEIIAAMIIDRQLKKIESRKKYSKPGKDIPEEDRW